MSEEKDGGKKKLVVDEDSCISCGTCYGMSPELFKSDDDGKPKIIKQPENAKEKKDAKEAIDSCPSRAISY